MKVVIVYESLFGNTEVVAEHVRQGLCRAGCETDLVEVGHAFAEPPDLGRCDLLVVAAPTHALSLSRPESRAEAVAKGADPLREKIGVREWLLTFTEALPDPTPRVAVFDTRVAKARHWSGSAAHRAARWLRKNGFEVIERTSFFVDGVVGPLSPGEAERAECWGVQLGEHANGVVRPKDGAGNHC